MTYQVLARKWRPPDFSSVVGQEPIVTALRNALTEGRIAQAYLFSGIRGVGKTTAARVLAKALNCERGPAADPCNECTVCREIAAGADLDVIEVDAATYSKVEQVRELTDSLRYGSARDRYKVVVIDEIHRLSRQAFDALLKIIEEPPAHLVFIFATTEIDAVPATILSRCQEFHFRRVPSDVVSSLLGTIAREEKIEATDAALRLIARAGEGSVRDSVALLDQLATFGAGTIADEDAMRLLGGMDTAMFEGVLAAILAGDRATIAASVHRIEDEGWDPRSVFAQFLAYVRDGLHLAIGGNHPEVATVDLPAEEAARLAERARAAGFENLLRLLRQLLASEETVRRSDASALALEIAWLRAAELPRLTRVEDLLAGRAPMPEAAANPGTARVPSAARPAPAPAPAPRPAPSPAQAPAPRADAEEPQDPTAPTAQTAQAAQTADRGPATDRSPAPATAPDTADAPPDSAPAGAGLPAPATVAGFLERLTDLKPALAGHLRHAEALRLDGTTLEIVISPDDDILPGRLQKASNRQLLDRALAEVLGPDVTWKTARGTGSVAPGQASAADPDQGHGEGQPHDQVQDNPTVQTVLEIFDGTVERVDEPQES